MQLAALGVHRLQLIDFDTVEPTNITSQGYHHADLGHAKVDATAREAQRIAPSLEVTTLADRFRPSRRCGDVVFCCVDSIQTRGTVWKSLQHRCRFWCDGRMRGEVLRILTVADPDSATLYAESLFPPATAQRGSCTGRSTLYAASVAAGLMLHQFVRWLRRQPFEPDLTLNLLANELTGSESHRASSAIRSNLVPLPSGK
ncbi:ThiF family adenylyltransferase [Maioricimonas sp. JC845]|uniref:ThiF family adenylyltransferase n=1 Tax=Maioricimonas sp. JC845 TaxID=3232138 RepID=UPI00345A92E2